MQEGMIVAKGYLLFCHLLHMVAVCRIGTFCEAAGIDMLACNCCYWQGQAKSLLVIGFWFLFKPASIEAL